MSLNLPGPHTWDAVPGVVQPRQTKASCPPRCCWDSAAPKLLNWKFQIRFSKCKTALIKVPLPIHSSHFVSTRPGFGWLRGGVQDFRDKQGRLRSNRCCIHGGSLSCHTWWLPTASTCDPRTAGWLWLPEQLHPGWQCPEVTKCRYRTTPAFSPSTWYPSGACPHWLPGFPGEISLSCPQCYPAHQCTSSRSFPASCPHSPVGASWKNLASEPTPCAKILVSRFASGGTQPSWDMEYLSYRVVPLTRVQGV